MGHNTHILQSQHNLQKSPVQLMAHAHAWGAYVLLAKCQ
jgi:hypothetical protein